MQVYDDRKERIGTLTGFRNRAITKTLSSGDKELSFEYPADGEMAGLLKEERYIRTKEDEFILKSVEAGEQYNRYTAMLNVEELEGKAFPYGFASKEQTVRACLEFAFEGTGWSVGACTVTKKRTVDIEGATTAWGVLQSCLSTYRCECRIDTLQKRIDIHVQIGRDRGCYFMEGLNLRRLTAKSDTYEFYTRIIPIGKDGITIGPIYGKDYLENYQYSTKVKTYTWKDERYTNTTSLMEDAEAKLEELSKPYKVYSADVVDLAKANEGYRDVLDYRIGDTVTMVSKRKRIREKQRIVKTIEYPEEPERNRVELSNTTKTFAEVQKAETELAKTEAISIANSTAKKVLQDYSTKEEVETKIVAFQEAIAIGVKHTLEGYYDKEETDARIDVLTGEVKMEVSKTLESYPTKDEVGAEISEDRASITLNTEAIKQKVSKGDVSSQISVEPDEVAIKSNRLIVESDNFSVTKKGEVSATGEFITKDKGLGLTSIQRGGGIRVLQNETDELGRLESGSAGGVRGIGLGAQKVMVFHNGSSIGYIYNPNSMIAQYADYRHVFTGSSHFLGDISVGGAKNRAVRTENYGTIAMNAVESASPVFADMGSGKIGADGRCYLMFDSIFRETIEGMHAYHVFVSGTSGKGCRCVSKEKDYAVIEGEAGEEFDWIIYGRQKGYAMTRMEALNIPDAAMLDNEDLLYNEYGGEDLETLAMNYLDEYEKEMVLL